MPCTSVFAHAWAEEARLPSQARPGELCPALSRLRSESVALMSGQALPPRGGVAGGLAGGRGEGAVKVGAEGDFDPTAQQGGGRCQNQRSECQE